MVQVMVIVGYCSSYIFYCNGSSGDIVGVPLLFIVDLLKWVRAIALCPGEIIQFCKQLVRQLSIRPADKRFCLPQADGSDLFLRESQSLKLKVRITFYKSPHLRLVITLIWVCQPFSSKVRYEFILFEGSEPLCVHQYDVIKVHCYSDEHCR